MTFGQVFCAVIGLLFNRIVKAKAAASVDKWIDKRNDELRKNTKPITRIHNMFTCYCDACNEQHRAYIERERYYEARQTYPKDFKGLTEQEGLELCRKWEAASQRAWEAGRERTRHLRVT